MRSNPSPARLLLAACLAAFAYGVQPTSAQTAPKGPGFAEPTATALAAAQQLLDVSGVQKQFEAMVPLFADQIAKIYIQQQPQHERVIREAFAAMTKRMSSRKDELIAEVAAVYARSFSEADLKELAAFFAGGAGRRFVEMQPQLLPETMRLGQRWGDRIGREIEIEMREELRQKGVPL
jgi:uncharacterized protein